MPTEQVSTLKKIVIASRPWSFPASTMPVIFGTVLAVTIGHSAFNPLFFVMSLIGMVILHAGANVLSDVNDFKNGLDTEITPVSGAIVREYFSPKQGLILGATMMAVGCGIGLALVYFVGMPILLIGLVGVAIGGFYSAPPFALKYHAMGDFAVFMDFGILGSLGAWTVQTGHLAAEPAIWAIPMALLVIGILHANNWRDMLGDTDGGIKTVASLLGDQNSLYYYGFLIFGPFAIVIGIIAFTHLMHSTMQLPLTSLLVLLALPSAWRLWKRGCIRAESTDPVSFILLDKGTADLNLIFGCLYTASLLLGKFL